MSRQKLKRFEEIRERRNVLEDDKPLYHTIKGNWNSEYFGNEHPITVEMGCGRGEYTVGLAKVFAEQNFIGVDVKGDRLWAGSTAAVKEGLQNVAFLRTQIQQIENFFATNEIDTIWITFPDPRPRESDIKRRLTSPRYLAYYKNILKPGGKVYLKTDNTGLFDYTLEVLQSRTDVYDLNYTHDLYKSQYLNEHHGIKTRFERKHFELGETIKYLKFKFDHEK